MAFKFHIFCVSSGILKYSVVSKRNVKEEWCLPKKKIYIYILSPVSRIPGRFFIGRVRKITKGDYLLRRVRLSVRIEQLGSHKLDFHKICYLNFSKICPEDSGFIKIWQDKHVTDMKTYVQYMYDNTSLISSWNEKCFRKTWYRKSEKHILFSISFSFEISSFY